MFASFKRMLSVERGRPPPTAGSRRSGRAAAVRPHQVRHRRHDVRACWSSRLTAAVGLAVDFGRVYAVNIAHPGARWMRPRWRRAAWPRSRRSTPLNKASTAAIAYFDQSKPERCGHSTHRSSRPTRSKPNSRSRRPPGCRTPFLGVLNILAPQGLGSRRAGRLPGQLLRLRQGGDHRHRADLPATAATPAAATATTARASKSP